MPELGMFPITALITWRFGGKRFGAENPGLKSLSAVPRLDPQIQRTTA